MDIRTITLFDNMAYPPRPDTLARAGRFLRAAQARAERAGLTVQTLRYATQSYATWLPVGREFPSACREAEQALLDAGFRYSSFGTLAGDAPDADLSPLEWVAAAIAETQNVSFSATFASARYGLALGTAQAVAGVVHQIARETSDGLGNLRFAALAGCPPHVPFFPVAYHDGGRPQFSIALEGAELAETAYETAVSNDDASERLHRAAATAIAPVIELAHALSRETGVRFRGIDLSTAPGAGPGRSFGHAVESLGVSRFGDAGTLYAVALTVSTLDAVRFPRAGFCGAMLPIMEDPVLAQRAAEGVLTVNDLLLFSAVCGTGLDTVPLPGDTTVGELASILLDIGALSVRLAKPLTARLMPVPGKKAGDLTTFESPYLVNTRVLATRGDASRILTGRG